MTNYYVELVILLNLDSSVNNDTSIARDVGSQHWRLYGKRSR